MSRTLIISVGIALLSNQQWRRGQPLPSEEAMMEKLCRPDTDLIKASLETHTLHRLPLMDDDNLYWLSSNTDECKLCAQVLSKYYGHGRVSEVRVIEELNYRKDYFEQGLKSLATTAARIVRNIGGPDNVIICATAGFKPEAAYLNIVGLLLQIPVCYLYEGSEHVVTLPRPPIERWSVDDIIDYLGLL